MNKRIVRGLGALLALGLCGLSVAAQRRGGGDPPATADWCTCTASGAHCLFGSAKGCGVACHKPLKCFCQGARCIFGFPIAATCECE